MGNSTYICIKAPNLKLKTQNSKPTQHPTTCPELAEGPNIQHFFLSCNILKKNQSLIKTRQLNQRSVHIHDDLVEGCRKNNRKAQLQLYNLYYKAMYNSAFRIVNNTAEAEDVMQEAFLTGFQKIDDFKGDSTIGAWLKKIVVNRALDQIRKKKEMVSLQETDLQIPVDDSTENFLEILSYKIEKIRKGIESLADDDRIILSLFLLEGYDHEEISQVLSISNNASRTRYSRARQRLRDLLKKNEIDQLVN